MCIVCHFHPPAGKRERETEGNTRLFRRQQCHRAATENYSELTHTHTGGRIKGLLAPPENGALITVWIQPPKGHFVCLNIGEEKEE